MSDWNSLFHAYGEASAIPALIDHLHTRPDEKTWQYLWSCLCHQGTVYSASYAALQPLCELAKTLSPSGRLPPLMLIGKIIVSDDLCGLDRRPVGLIEPLLLDLQALADESMKATGLEAKVFIYYLEAASAFAGDLFWGRQLDHLVDGEFPGRCPACRHELHLVIGDYGFFATAQEWVRSENTNVMRSPIAPVNQQELTGRGAWLHSKALGHGQPEVASCIRHIFGTATCTACGRKFEVAEAITLGLIPSQSNER